VAARKGNSQAPATPGPSPLCPATRCYARPSCITFCKPAMGAVSAARSQPSVQHHSTLLTIWVRGTAVRTAVRLDCREMTRRSSDFRRSRIASPCLHHSLPLVRPSAFPSPHSPHGSLQWIAAAPNFCDFPTFSQGGFFLMRSSFNLGGPRA
jgi:hypothetical protein